jgi:uncharacterized MAPEG superfamily protein
MSVDLWYLAYTAILTAALWIPYITCQVITNGFLEPPNYVDPAPRPVPLWGTRAHRAYLNAAESFAPFAVLVILLHIAGKADSMTATLTMSYFWLRVVHAIVYMLGIRYIRTVVFTLSFLCEVWLFCILIR